MIDDPERGGSAPGAWIEAINSTRRCKAARPARKAEPERLLVLDESWNGQLPPVRW